MTSRIIVAIVAAVLSLAAPVAAPVAVVGVLSLAAPVAVYAQTPTLTLTTNTIGATMITYSGFTSGTTYYLGGCWHSTSQPASCTFNSMGFATGAGIIGGPRCLEVSSRVLDNTPTSGHFYGSRYWGGYGDHVRTAAYSDSSCTTEVAAVTYTKPGLSALPTWRARDISDTSATIYIEDAHSMHNIWLWSYEVTPGDGVCRVAGGGVYDSSVLSTASPTSSLTGLSAGVTYTYEVYATSQCSQVTDALASVTFTTLDGGPPTAPPGPAPPTGVEVTATTDATTDGSGSVTLSWSNPGDPDIASYEYYLRRSGGVGEWRTVAGSNADTTSVTIDLTTGEAVAGNARGLTPTVEWTVYLRTRGVNGGSSRATEITFTTLGSVSEPEETPDPPEETPGSVPALPLAGLVTLAVALFLGGLRKRKHG